MENLILSAQNPDVAKSFSENLGRKLEEAAIESGLLQGSRKELPNKIRTLANKMEQAGIKGLELNSDNLSFFWPDGIRKSYSSETDDYTINEWQGKEIPRTKI